MKFEKPVNLNGDKLIAELLAAGVKLKKNDAFESGYEPPYLENDGFLYIEIAVADADKAQLVVSQHNAFSS